VENIYDKLGGDDFVRRLSDQFYQNMDKLPEVKELRDMHPTPLKSSADKLYMFLSGWLGGPQLFEKQYGHPRLRARHMPFSIGKKERDQWMLCMVKAFEDLKVEEPYRSELLHALLRLADHMRNKTEIED